MPQGAALRAYSQVLGKEAVAVLKTLAADKDDHIKYEAARAIISHSDRDALAMLLKLLNSEDLTIRVRSAKVLRAVSGNRFGFVAYEDRRWPVRIQHRESFVHALVVDDEINSNTIWKARRLTAAELGDPSRSARALAVEAISERMGVSESGLRIQRSGRIPQLIVAGADEISALSLSHHGAYVGFACRFRAQQEVIH